MACWTSRAHCLVQPHQDLLPCRLGPLRTCRLPHAGARGGTCPPTAGADATSCLSSCSGKQAGSCSTALWAPPSSLSPSHRPPGTPGAPPAHSATLAVHRGRGGGAAVDHKGRGEPLAAFLDGCQAGQTCPGCWGAAAGRSALRLRSVARGRASPHSLPPSLPPQGHEEGQRAGQGAPASPTQAEASVCLAAGPALASRPFLQRWGWGWGGAWARGAEVMPQRPGLPPASAPGPVPAGLGRPGTVLGWARFTP